MGRWRELRQLAAALRGEPEADCDWPAVLNLANRSLVTPSLAPEIAPPEHAGFLAEVRRRNRDRNERLGRQLAEATAALNAAGIEPVLLKGAALWAAFGDPFDRLMSDVDLLVAPDEVEAALAALQAAGFPMANRYPGDAVHVVAELGRPQDVGYLDLHQRPPGPPGLTDSPALAARRRLADVGGGRAWLPDAASQLLMLVLHDQLHDGDYWRGGFDLRHLIDLARLAPLLSAADWEWLDEACGSRLVRRALAAELAAAEALIGGTGRPADASARRTYARWRRQYAWPVLRLPLAAWAVAWAWPDLADYRAVDRAGRRRVLGESTPRRQAPGERLARVRKIATAASGKI